MAKKKTKDLEKEAAEVKEEIKEAKETQKEAKSENKENAEIKEAPKEAPKEIKVAPSEYKLFNKWDTNVTVDDLGIKPYINLREQVIPRSAGINQKHRFHKSHINIIERLALHLMQPGHQGKKHKLSSGRRGGALESTLRAIEDAFTIVEKETGKNPVAVFVKAIENAALREEITSVQMGSQMVRSAVITSPQRRVDRVLRMLAQGTYKRTYGKKLNATKALAAELIDAYNNSDKSIAIAERMRLEGEAEGAR